MAIKGDTRTLLDAQSSVLEIMEANQLKKWSKISPRVFTPESSSDQQVKNFETSPFPYDHQLNEKIVLWAGDLTLLGCEAIVNSTNENFTDRNALSMRILRKGGPRLLHEIKENIKCCKTGDARISEGYDLPARYVIHTVGPKYDKKYHTAAEGALFSAYSKVLQLAREKKIRTLGLCPINSIRRGYPPHEGAHIALRVVRRFLEKHRDDFELLVFAVEDVDVGIYELILPLYFPRSPQEECYAQSCLPPDVGGIEGEPVIPERQIRIGVKPMASITEDFDRTIDLESGLDSSIAVGKTPFAKMQADVDKRWTGPRDERNKTANDPMTQRFEIRHRYERLLRRAKTEQFKELRDLRFMYSAGNDRNGRPVAVIIGNRFPGIGRFDEETMLSFMISILEPMSHHEFVLIYFHTLAEGRNAPSLNFVKYMMETLEGGNYKNCLKSLFIVHPTIWCRVASWWFTTFSQSGLKEKLFFLGGIEYLKHIIPMEQLEVPASILDHDFKVNGSGYHSVPEPSKSHSGQGFPEG